MRGRAHSLRLRAIEDNLRRFCVSRDGGTRDREYPSGHDPSKSTSSVTLWEGTFEKRNDAWAIAPQSIRERALGSRLLRTARHAMCSKSVR